MAHDFAHAYGNVKLAVEGLVAADSLRISLNRASAYFTIINDDDFNKSPGLRLEFRHLRSRLRRDVDYVSGSLTKSLDSTDDDGMKVLAENLFGFMEKMNGPAYEAMIPHPVSDNWEEENEGD